MHPRALPSGVVLETRALPADAERVGHRVTLDAHHASAGRTADRDRVRAETVADVLCPDEILDLTSGDFGTPAALGTDDHGTCVALALGEPTDNGHEPTANYELGGS